MKAEMVPVGEIKVMGDVSASILIGTEGTRTQRAIDDRVLPIAEQVVSGNPQVVDAAAARVGALKASELELVQGKGLVSDTSTADVSWTFREPQAALPRYVTPTVVQTSTKDTPVEVKMPVVDPETGKLDESLLPEGLAPDDTGISLILATPNSKSARLLVQQFGGRLVFTDPQVGGVGDGVTDNTAAFNRAMVLIGATGGEVFFPPGVYRIDGTTLPVPGGVTLRGTGIPYADPTDAIVRCSVIRAGAAMTRLIELGADPTSSLATNTSASMVDLFVDGRDLADYTVLTSGRRWMIDHCLIYWGRLIGLEVEGQNGSFHGFSTVAQNNTGSCIRVTHEPDNKFSHGQLRQPGPDGACMMIQPIGSSTLGTGNILVGDLHMWTGQNGVPTPGSLITLKLDSSKTIGGVHIIRNQLEGVIGDQIVIIADGTSTARNILIEANNVFQNSAIVDNARSFLAMSGTGKILDLSVVGNMLYGPSTTKRWRSIIHDAGTGERSRMLLANNVGRRVTTPWTKAVGSAWSGPEPGINVGIGADGNEWRTRVADRTTLTGADGSKVVFTVASGLPFKTARAINLTAMSSAAARPHFVDLADGTLTITFDAAPAAGADLRVAYDLWQ
ncbi:hypothetical protein GTU73_08745 [Rathayibacter sp. VKM Ac-2804]|uniref:glycosyl hydrolase family 28-related protein n=1 Tax=Rathayibacter sp. VKM Ac-2804 TaxID=2609257 RepID=UPI00132E76B7|nr:glycosyl hydrolase family 28-related protein [Rathayibacter sp. VKM Ac-2804]QHF24088.1 hypothetical protein GTU73_08745 [Rathayibacter sp. VKM Ac-2804]